MTNEEKLREQVRKEVERQAKEFVDRVEGEREESPFRKNEISQVNYEEIKLAKSLPEKIEAMYSYVQEELGQLNSVPAKVEELLEEYEIKSRLAGGVRTRDFLDNRRFELLQQCIRYVQPLRGYEPDIITEQTIVEGVSGEPQGYAPSQRSYSLTRSISDARRETKNKDGKK